MIRSQYASFTSVPYFASPFKFITLFHTLVFKFVLHHIQECGILLCSSTLGVGGYTPRFCSNSLGFVVTLLWGEGGGGLFQGLSLVAFSKIVCVIPFGRPRQPSSQKRSQRVGDILRYIENDRREMDNSNLTIMGRRGKGVVQRIEFCNILPLC